MSFENLGLSEKVLQAVKEQGWEEATEIQARSIPPGVSGRDIVGASQTGTGKTAAFALPILTCLNGPWTTRVLILEPTRELAAQVADVFEEMGKPLGITTALIHGGVGYGKQDAAFERGVDVVVATPGRLLDHLQRKNVHFKCLEFLVLDEVDRMLDMGFLPDVRRIINQCPKERQTFFFSATMPPQIDGLAKWCLRDPVEIEVGLRISAAETVTHSFYPVSMEQRDDLLFAIIDQTDFKSLMIFTRTKVAADRLARTLAQRETHTVTAMHSDIRQSDRTKALKGFKEGAFDIIVATDIAARGLDISGVSHVVNYNVPENAEDYVHRIGRTGRARSEGEAFTLITADEVPFAESIERLIGRKIDRNQLENFDYKYSAILDDDAPTPEKIAKSKGRRLGPRPKRKRATRRR